MSDTAPETPVRDVMTPPEVIVVETHNVSCDGGGGALGHPKVWYEIDQTGFAECGYCDRRFVLKGGPADPGAQ